MLFHDKQRYLNMKPNLLHNLFIPNICNFIQLFSSSTLHCLVRKSSCLSASSTMLIFISESLLLLIFLVATPPPSHPHYDYYVTNCFISHLLTLQYSRKTSITALNSILKVCTWFIYNKTSSPNDIFHSLKSSVLLSCSS